MSEHKIITGLREAVQGDVAAVHHRPNSDKLANISDGFRVATEAYEIACRHGVNGGAERELFDLVKREANKAEGST